MQLFITEDAEQMGRYTAEKAADDLRSALASQETATILVATGASQFEVLSQLIAQPDIDWKRVVGYHLDEYVGLGPDHPASFCGYLRDRFVSKVPLKTFHYLRGDHEVEHTVAIVGQALAATQVDVALVGIGENGHLAFNDPPANFEATEPYLIVQLDEACRKQQVGEGWFASMADVPTHAISMSVQQILRSRKIYCSVPDQRKSVAVRNTIEGPITNQVPASILQSHPATTLVIDRAAASLLKSNR